MVRAVCRTPELSILEANDDDVLEFAATDCATQVTFAMFFRRLKNELHKRLVYDDFLQHFSNGLHGIDLLVLIRFIDLNMGPRASAICCRKLCYFVVSLSAAAVDDNTDNNTETRLFNELFGPAAKYDQRARPQHHAVNVSIIYMLDSILELVFNNSFGEISRTGTISTTGRKSRHLFIRTYRFCRFGVKIRSTLSPTVSCKSNFHSEPMGEHF